MSKKAIGIDVSGIVKELSKREKEQDAILGSVREIVRHCSTSIKMTHAGEIKNAKKELEAAKKMIAPFAKTRQFEYLLAQPYQEIVEAELLLAAVERKALPTFGKMGMPFEPYLLGLCDLVGELRRQMLEELKRGDRKEAARYFELMSGIYDELMPIRFSNSLLPNFRKKQDVARSQVEQARSELVRAKMR